MRLLTSKTYAWFWLLFGLGFGVFDLVVGSPVFGLIMLLIAGYWAWTLYLKYTGNDWSYNQYHGKG